MPTNENHVKVIKVLLETPDATLTKIGEQTDLSSTSVHKIIQEINTIYTEKLVKEEDDIPATMAANYDGAITTDDMLKVLEVVERRSKKVNNRNETKDNTSEMSTFSDNNSNSAPLEIDTTTKALQLVLSNFKGKNISQERISGIINLYRAQEFKYKKEPWLIRPMLVNILGAGLGEEAFKQFMDLVQYYVPPADGFQFTNQQQQHQVANGGIDPALMAMMSNGDPNSAALMAAMSAGGSSPTGGGDFFQKMLLMDMMEERRRKREREDRELQDKEQERRIAIKREMDEAKDRQMMQMMMFGMMKQNGNDQNGGIPPGYAAETYMDEQGRPVTKLTPLPNFGAQGVAAGAANPAEMFKSMVEVAKLVQAPQGGNKSDELLAQFAMGAFNKLNMQSDPLESAAKAIEMADKLRPQGNTPDPYEQINAKIALLDKEMEWAMKKEEREERIMDKKLAQENTKGYIDTIERVVTNVGAPLVEKFSQGMLRQQQAQQAPPVTVVGSSAANPQPQMDIANLPDEQLEKIARQGDEMMLENEKVREKIKEEMEKRRIAKGEAGALDGVEGGNEGESNMQGGNGYDVNIR